jgi:hypothetical protein
MTPDAWFLLANPFALLGWLMLTAGLFSPPSGAWRARLLFLAGRVWPLLLAVGYAVALAMSWGSAPGGGFGTLDEVAALFRSPGNLLAGWLHYLAFDLFVGRWIVDDALSRAGPRWPVLPCLALTFLFGPVGLLLHFALRAAHGARGGSHAH